MSSENERPGSGGWPAAIGVILLAAVLTGAAYAIHVKTYCAPSHPMCNASTPAAEHAPAAEHEPAH